jgi:hypothetical protein
MVIDGGRVMVLNKKGISLGKEAGLFVDDYLVEWTRGTTLKMNPPQQREIALKLGEVPWEGLCSGCYLTVIKDDGTFRMYYRVHFSDADDHPDDDELQGYCCAESSDGIYWTRPEYGIIDFNGSKRNNLVFTGPLAHNLSPFIDTNPLCRSEQRYKAVAGAFGGLRGFTSPDGLHWQLVCEKPMITEGTFDSQNLVLWDGSHYVCWSRYLHNLGGEDCGRYPQVRAIQSCISDDFIHWGPQRHNCYAPGVPYEHFYTNSTTRCPGAESTFLSFPMRLVIDRKKIPEHPWPDISDNTIMSSHDGVNWERPFLCAWCGTTLDRRNWTERNHQVASGILQTTPDEFSFYVTHHMRWNDVHIRRYSLPRHRFASVSADYCGGELLTRPIEVSGKTLVLNYATSAPGSVLVQLEDQGHAIPGFTFGDCTEIYGNELDYAVSFKGPLANLAGREVRLRFQLKSADIFALRFE